MDKLIKVRGAKQNNLKNVDMDIPKNKLVVFTGVSGSGKSSMAFDTIYAEGQRRYVESLSSYARQFLGVLAKPDVELIEGLSPAISIDQKSVSKNPRSTVGTITEIYDYLRLLFARIGHPNCPICGKEIKPQSADQIVDGIINKASEIKKSNGVCRFMILSPLIKDKKGEFIELFRNIKQKGFREVRIDGQIRSLNEDFSLLKNNRHNIEAVIDKFTYSDHKSFDKKRLLDAVEISLKLSNGLAVAVFVMDASFTFPEYPKDQIDYLFSEMFACPIDGIQIPEIEPRTFSFNSPHGACDKCSGLGKILKASEELIIAPELTLLEGGLIPFATMFEYNTYYSKIIRNVCDKYSIPLNKKIADLNEEQMHILLYGKDDFGGVLLEIERRYQNTDSDYIRGELNKYLIEMVCNSCQGQRLTKEALSIKINNLSIAEVSKNNIKSLYSWISSLEGDLILSSKEKLISDLIIKEIKNRLTFLLSVGLDYLTIDRTASTLSGGESQRIRLASQVGSGLTGVLYVLDEPTIGLHQKDNQKLIATLQKLRDMDNSVIVVEHDRELMLEADYVFDFGPQAGRNGGMLVAEGTPLEIKNNKKSVTGKYLRQEFLKIDHHKTNNLNDNKIIINGCNQNNLKDINVAIPLSKLIAITGVSGSGKSSLLVETLFPAIQKELGYAHKVHSHNYTRLDGVNYIDKIVLIDQSPIGRTPRSNPATYIKLFDLIRDIYAESREARLNGYKKGRFSFNVRGGRCEACEGQGQIKIEMQFMSDIWITCDTCKGTRYNSGTLDVLYNGKNIADVLKMTVTEALDFFKVYKGVTQKLDMLDFVGLSYIELGQSATTLSGGEAQRIKLAAELSKKDTGKTLYILDEPTTGLHFQDVEKLLKVLRTLVNRGNTVIVVEHNLDVIRNSDYIIDLGPEGGDKGGEIIAVGTVSEVKKNPKSVTGKYL